MGNKHLLEQHTGNDQPLWVVVDGKARPLAHHRTSSVGAYDQPRLDFFDPAFLFRFWLITKNDS